MEAKSRLARWIMGLQEFHYSVIHRAGRVHNNADALFRLVEPNLSASTSSLKAAYDPKFVSTIRITLPGGCTEKQ